MPLKTSQFAKMKRFRRLWRATAVLFISTGGILSIVGVYLLVAPEAVIVYNGIPTTERGPKLFFTLFSAVFVVLGVASSLVPRRWLDRMFVWRQSVLYSLFSWR
jgi:hypothetical protein